MTFFIFKVTTKFLLLLSRGKLKDIFVYSYFQSNLSKDHLNERPWVNICSYKQDLKVHFSRWHAECLITTWYSWVEFRRSSEASRMASNVLVPWHFPPTTTALSCANAADQTFHFNLSHFRNVHFLFSMYVCQNYIHLKLKSQCHVMILFISIYQVDVDN